MVSTIELGWRTSVAGFPTMLIRWQKAMLWREERAAGGEGNRGLIESRNASSEPAHARVPRRKEQKKKSGGQT